MDLDARMWPHASPADASSYYKVFFLTKILDLICFGAKLHCGYLLNIVFVGPFHESYLY